MSNIQDTIPPSLVRRRHFQNAIEMAAFAGLVLLVAGAAVVTKEAQARAGLASLSAVSEVAVAEEAPALAAVVPTPSPTVPPAAPEVPELTDGAEAEVSSLASEPEVVRPTWDPQTRWFNARPVRPARTIWMKVTAYSPDERSCGDSADGITSSIHNVYTNAMKLVAADSRVLPLGSMISVPGYDSGNVVPVLDRGGAIKGHRLDLLFPTHEAARKWGVKHIPITVWEYADGKPADDFRKIRDSKN